MWKMLAEIFIIEQMFLFNTFLYSRSKLAPHFFEIEQKVIPSFSANNANLDAGHLHADWFLYRSSSTNPDFRFLTLTSSPYRLRKDTPLSEIA